MCSEKRAMLGERNPERLLAFAPAGYVKIHAAVVVGFGGGWQVELGEWNFLRTLGGKDPQRLADDGVILHFLFVQVAEDQDRGRSGFRALFFFPRALLPARRRRRRLGIRVLI